MNQCAVLRLSLVTLVLGMTLFLPSLLRAGTITLDIPPGPAHPIDSVSFGNDTAFFFMPESVFVNVFQKDLGRTFHTVIVTETSNVVIKVTLTNDFFTSVVIRGGTADVGVLFKELKITTGPIPTPEPSSLILLGAGLFGLIGLRHRFA